MDKEISQINNKEITQIRIMSINRGHKEAIKTIIITKATGLKNE
jgi:hypothetical protein